MLLRCLDDRAGIVIHNHCDILVTFLVACLINADIDKAIKVSKFPMDPREVKLSMRLESLSTRSGYRSVSRSEFVTLVSRGHSILSAEAWSSISLTVLRELCTLDAIS